MSCVPQRVSCVTATLAVLALLLAASPAAAQPRVGQAGKDAVWVPTPPETVEKMLDVAGVTPEDFVVDLGSGDGRNVIAAAKRGARGLGVEYDEELVEVSRQAAEREGVSNLVTFVRGDMYEADISDATVLALFLLPENLRRLEPKFLDLAPGTRIVVNTFGIDGWEPDVVEEATEGCSTWCTTMLYLVPARVGGAWRLPLGTLTFDQQAQKLSGTLASGENAKPVENGRVRGDQVTFTVGEAEYSGRVVGDTLEGTVTSNGRQDTFRATRQAG
jgi:SAM-dependent methyltransferase